MLVKVDGSDHRALEQDSIVDAPYRLVAPKNLIKEPDSR